MASFFNRCITTVLLLVIAFVFLLNFHYIVRNYMIVYLLVVVLCFAVLIFALKKIDLAEKNYFVLLIIASLGLKLIVGLLINASPMSDFRSMYEAAGQVAMGDYSFQNDSYYFFWAFQTGFVLYQSMIIKIFGLSTIPLIFMNAVFMTGINVLIYLIIKKLSSNINCAKFGSAIYLFYPAPYFLASVLTNQHLAAMFILLGIYFVICVEENSVKNYIFGGIFISLGNIMRPIGIVAVFSIICYFIHIFFINNNNLKSEKRFFHIADFLIRPVVLIATYCFIGFIASSLIIATGVNSQGLKNNDPYWKFVLGLNYESNGGYSQSLASQVFAGHNIEEQYKIERSIIKDSIHSLPSKLPSFLYRKNKIMWAENEDLAWSFSDQASYNRTEEASELWREIAYKWLKIDKSYYFILWALAFISSVHYAKSKTINMKFNLCAIIFLVYFMVHLLIEIQVRYRYFAMIFICIIAAEAYLLIDKNKENQEHIPSL